METVPCLAAVLLATSAVMIAGANPVNVPECALQPVTEAQGVKVFYTTSRVTSGCTSRGPTDPNLEVHALFLRYSTPELVNLQFNVSVSAGKENRKYVIVVSSNKYSLLTVNTEVQHLTFVTAKGNSMVQKLNGKNEKADLSSSSEGLLNWTKMIYRGVSSFAELENPQQIHFQLGGEPSSKKDCVPEKNFSAEPYLEFEVASNNIRGCLPSSESSQKEAHILWLQQDPQGSGTQEVDMNIKLTCSERKPKNQPPILLVLKSHNSLTWNIGQIFDSFQFLVSGEYKMKNFGDRQISGNNLPDSKEGLLAEASRNKSAFVASYTEIPSAKSITLELVRACATQATPVTTKAETEDSSVKNLIQGMIKTSKPWRCTDSGIEITLAKDYFSKIFSGVTSINDVTLQDRNCRARDNNTHFVLTSKLRECNTYLERDIVVKNELVFNMHLIKEEITVPFECDLPEKVFLQLYHTTDFESAPTTVAEVNKAIYVQAQFRTTDQEAQLQIVDCSLQMPDKASSQLLISSGKPLSYSAKILGSPRSTIGRFSFIYKTGEEQWAASPATLVCKLHLHSQLRGNHSNETSLEMTIKNPRPTSHNQGLGTGTVLGITFGAFLIGVLLTAALWYIYSHTRPVAKMQPVSANPTASESSSTNHSIGSTQSTPCSTSSMA